MKECNFGVFINCQRLQSGEQWHNSRLFNFAVHCAGNTSKIWITAYFVLKFWVRRHFCRAANSPSLDLSTESFLHSAGVKSICWRRRSKCCLLRSTAHSPFEETEHRRVRVRRRRRRKRSVIWDGDQWRPINATRIRLMATALGQLETQNSIIIICNRFEFLQQLFIILHVVAQCCCPQLNSSSDFEQ